ncbi:signal peptide-containing protein [Cryptosporidium canis]|uniref:Signal peptide-containing protein n=1 Tax=Cryptosporidium canis TaxID=195482 RepID=A0A9D5DG23_9CRYT|nr:signal peptide-containing protein [Cryptosporidium canis]
MLVSVRGAGQLPLEPRGEDGSDGGCPARSAQLVVGSEGEVGTKAEAGSEVEAGVEVEGDSAAAGATAERGKEKRTRSIIDSLLPNTEYCTEELSKLLDFSSIVSSSCGVDALKKVGGWLNKHKNSLPYWPSVSLPAPKNLITFYGCDWTICEREVENQIDQKLKRLHLPVKQIGNADPSDTRNYSNAKKAMDIQIRNGNMSRGELINSIGIWWCQKALPQLITDKETAYHSIFKEFNIQIDQQSGETESEAVTTGASASGPGSGSDSDQDDVMAEESRESAERAPDVSVMVTKDDGSTHREIYKYPSRLVFLKTALEEPMECYGIEPEKDNEATKDELREILDGERNRLESNLAFVLQIGTTIWRSNKTFSPLGKSTNSVQRLIGTMRAYTEEIRRDLFKLFPPVETGSVTAPIPPHEDVVILVSEICRIQSITDAISQVVIKLLRRNKFSKKVSEDAEHLLMNWMFADMNVKKSLIPVTKPVVTKKSSPSFIERAKRMKMNASRITKFMNAIADKD